VRLASLIIAVAAALAASAVQAADSPFKNWAVMLAAADYRSAGGADSDVFDNGRRDVGKALAQAGFSPENMLHVSTRPYRYDNPKPIGTEPPGAFTEAWKATAQKAPDGCLVFVTSHGHEEGVIFGMLTRSPANMADLIGKVCGERPTVAIISACHSGVFIPALSGPNRMVMTAARADRTSFGCGQDNVYTFFDECLITAIPKVKGLEGLPETVRTCVEAKETELGAISEDQVADASRNRAAVLLPSAPQTWIGEAFKASLPTYLFVQARPTTVSAPAPQAGVTTRR